jgi:hypothetical protein
MATPMAMATASTTASKSVSFDDIPDELVDLIIQYTDAKTAFKVLRLVNKRWHFLVMQWLRKPLAPRLFLRHNVPGLPSSLENLFFSRIMTPFKVRNMNKYHPTAVMPKDVTRRFLRGNRDEHDLSYYTGLEELKCENLTYFPLRDVRAIGSLTTVQMLRINEIGDIWRLNQWTHLTTLELDDITTSGKELDLTALELDNLKIEACHSIQRISLRRANTLSVIHCPMLRWLTSRMSSEILTLTQIPATTQLSGVGGIRTTKLVCLNAPMPSAPMPMLQSLQVMAAPYFQMAQLDGFPVLESLNLEEIDVDFEASHVVEGDAPLVLGHAYLKFLLLSEVHGCTAIIVRCPQVRDLEVHLCADVVMIDVREIAPMASMKIMHCASLTTMTMNPLQSFEEIRWCFNPSGMLEWVRDLQIGNLELIGLEDTETPPDAIVMNPSIDTLTLRNMRHASTWRLYLEQIQYGAILVIDNRALDDE